MEKVSYERLGIELDKMFEGNNPQISVLQLHQFNVIQLLYKLPDSIAELKDTEFVESLIKQSVQMCQVLGYLFKQLKDQAKDD